MELAKRTFMRFWAVITKKTDPENKVWFLEFNFILFLCSKLEKTKVQNFESFRAGVKLRHFTQNPSLKMLSMQSENTTKSFYCFYLCKFDKNINAIKNSSKRSWVTCAMMKFESCNRNHARSWKSEMAFLWFMRFQFRIWWYLL